MFFYLRFQLFSYKEFMFSIKQTLISRLIDIAKVMQEMAFKKYSSYYLSNYVSARTSSSLQKSEKEVGIRHNSFAVANLWSISTHK